MWNLFDEIGWSDTNQFNSERFGCSETQFKIVVNFENRHVFNIFDNSEINGICINNVNNFTEKDTIIESVEERITIACNWEIISTVFVTLENNIDQFRESGYLSWGIRMLSTMLILNLSNCGSISICADFTKSIWVVWLGFNHHSKELTPTNNSILIGIICIKHCLSSGIISFSWT